MTNRSDAKNTMLLHSEAKVEFFKKYLQRYLRIVYRAKYISEINIIDVFCGTGIYDNGKKGSPIVSFESIAAIRDEYGFEKPIKLVVNDSEPEKIEAVRKHIEERNRNFCTIEYHEQPANQMFAKVLDFVNRQAASVRNLIFIDPYGYKEIKKGALEGLLSNRRTEIILFLPISQMQRFTTAAVSGDLKAYEPLKEFVHSFFPGEHAIKHEKVTALEYIDFVKEALKFNAYFSTSYYIERDESNYYALFFVTSRIYGFEKILEVKWQLDEESGGGFRQPKQPSFFDQEEKELQKIANYERLEHILKESLNTPKTNQDLYEIVLKNEFLPTHANKVLGNWQDDNPNFRVTDIATEKPARRGRFYINWESYNPTKNKNPKMRFSLTTDLY